MPAKISTTSKPEPKKRVIGYRGIGEEGDASLYIPLKGAWACDNPKPFHLHLMTVTKGSPVIYLNQKTTNLEPIYEGETITLTVE